IIPANQDTVLKMLDMPGKSDIFYKSLQPYVLSRSETVVGGFDSKAHSSHVQAARQLNEAAKKETGPKRAFLEGRSEGHQHQVEKEDQENFNFKDKKAFSAEDEGHQKR